MSEGIDLKDIDGRRVKIKPIKGSLLLRAIYDFGVYRRNREIGILDRAVRHGECLVCLLFMNDWNEQEMARRGSRLDLRSSSAGLCLTPCCGVARLASPRVETTASPT